METVTEKNIKGNHAAELKALTAKLSTADAELQSLGKREEVKKIIEIIRKQPGWTTPAELAFTNLIANSIISQAKTIQTTLQEFARGASLVKEL